MRVSLVDYGAFVAAFMAVAGCGQNESPGPSADGQHVRNSSPEERQLADPLHTPYLKLLYAADNLKWCKRDQDKLAFAAFAQQSEAEALARSKGMGESLALTRRIFATRSMEELRVVCSPNFEQAVQDVQRAVEEFRSIVVELPKRK